MAFPANPIDGQPSVQAGTLYIYSAIKTDWILYSGNIPGADAINWKDNYDALITYAIRDGVLSGGRSFRSLQANNKAHTPPATGNGDLYWYLVSDKGATGNQGNPGADGQAIDHLSQTAGNGAAGTTDTYTVWGDAGETINLGAISAYNGADGAGTGDMLAANNLSDVANAPTARSNLGMGNVQNIKHNMVAIVAPAVGDDSAAGYASGSRWVDTVAGKTYACTDATAAAAVWKETTNPAAAGGAAPTIQVFAASGTYTKPAGLKAARVRVVGGGGGGARGTTSYTGSGGGGGGYAEKLIDAAIIGATETVTVGQGGGGGATIQAPGIVGSTSSFGTHCSGTGGSAGSYSSWLIAGGSGYGGHINISGGAGHPAIINETTSSPQPSGGHTPLGMGPLFIANASIASAYSGTRFGSGGAGVRAAGAGAGAGAAGIVIVEEFY